MKPGGAGSDAGRRAGGFTLLELLTVIAIMVILMSIAGASYNGMMRSGGLRGALSNLRETLSLARQFAVTHRARTHTLFSQDGTNAHYIVCVQDGQHVGDSGSDVLQVDGPRWSPGALYEGTIYNLTTGQRGKVVENSASALKATLLTGGPMLWSHGDRSGWVIRDQQHLATGLAWGANPNTPMPSETPPPPVVFKADGTTPLQGTGSYVIDIKEVRGLGHVQVKVEGLTGKITVHEDVN